LAYVVPSIPKTLFSAWVLFKSSKAPTDLLEYLQWVTKSPTLDIDAFLVELS